MCHHNARFNLKQFTTRRDLEPIKVYLEVGTALESFRLGIGHEFWISSPPNDGFVFGIFHFLHFSFLGIFGPDDFWP